MRIRSESNHLQTSSMVNNRSTQATGQAYNDGDDDEKSYVGDDTTTLATATTTMATTFAMMVMMARQISFSDSDE